MVHIELWDILDENGNPTGKLVERGTLMNDDEFHLVVHIWIRDSKGNYLISKRAESKPNSGMWETTAGSAIAGEASIQAAIRETKEELGIVMNPKDFRSITRIKRMNVGSPDFVDVWFCKCDLETSCLEPDPDEVSDVRWASRDEIIQMIEQGTFLNVFPYLDQLFLNK